MVATVGRVDPVALRDLYAVSRELIRAGHPFRIVCDDCGGSLEWHGASLRHALADCVNQSDD